MLSRQLLVHVRGMCKSSKEYWQVPKINTSIRGANLFNRAFGKYLFLTNTLTSGVLMGFGDIMQQEIEYKRHMLAERYDWGRITRMFLVGLSMGPLHHYFYKYLESYLPKRNIFSITKKIFLDQLIMSPICIGWFFYGMGLLERKSMHECTDEINGKFVEVYLLLVHVRGMLNKNWHYWQKPKIHTRCVKLVKLSFGKYLFLTNTLTSGVLLGFGDFMEQEIESRRNLLSRRYNWGRMTRMFLVGLGMGPIHHYFYKHLEYFLPKRDLYSIMKKIFLDQLIMAPVSIALFFYGVDLLEGKNLDDSTTELNGKFVEVYMIDWSVWPPTQFINFYFLPVQYQVLYINFVTMVYNVFLSYIKHRELAQEIRGPIDIPEQVN